MLYVCSRRRSRQFFVKILIILGIFIILSFLIHSRSSKTKILKSKESLPRLFCVLINRHSTHERFAYMSNITWAKHCHKIGIIRYRRLQGSDDEINLPQSTYYVNLWTRILNVIRQFISPSEYISNNDLLIVVPAPIFIFREKLSLLFNNSQLPLIIIHEQQEGNAYIINGQALNLLRNTDLMDLCLQQVYPSAREIILWKCIKSSLKNKPTDTRCENKNCFIQYHHYQVTLSQIKNGFCLENNHHICQSTAFLYPLTLNDLITLEFFKYRLKTKSAHDLL